jgi:hypothetical protein
MDDNNPSHRPRMELTLTKSQKQYLDKKGVISATSLQKAYTNSVKEQQSLKKAADKLRKNKSD